MTLFEKLTDKKIVTITNDDNMAGLVHKQLNSLEKNYEPPNNYFNVTELKNTAQAYWDRINRIEPPLSVQRKLNLGRKLHRIAGAWFRTIPGFEKQEAILDGIWVGIEGVRGKFDLLYGDSIVEIKTKPLPVDNIDDIFSQYPQDLEQLLFYVAISTRDSNVHFLVFMTDTSPHQIFAYKIKIKEIEPIKECLRDRIYSLEKARKERTPEILGRCRYMETGCQYDLNGICKCREIPPPDIKFLKEIIDIERDEDIEKKLIEAKENYKNMFKEVLTPYQILFPRKWYKWNIDGIKDTINKSARKEADEEMLGRAIYNVSEFNTSNSIPRDLWNIPGIAVNIPKRFITLKRSGSEPIVVPYLYSVSNIMKVSDADRPHDILIGQLAINCAFTGTATGVIFVLYPYLNRRVYAFILNFSDIIYIKDETLKQVEKILNVIKTDVVYDLDPCQGWMRLKCGNGCRCKKG